MHIITKRIDDFSLLLEVIQQLGLPSGGKGIDIKA